MPHGNCIPSTLLLLTKFLLTLSRNTKIKNDSQRTLLCSALCHPIVQSLHFADSALCWLHQGPVSLESAPRSPPQSDSSPALPSPLVSCREAPWMAALRPWSSNTRRARSNGRILQLGRFNISRPSTARLSKRFALLDCRWKRLRFFTRLCAQRLLSSLVRRP